MRLTDNIMFIYNVKAWDLRASSGPIKEIFGPHICGDSISFAANSKIIFGSWRKNDSIQVWDTRNECWFDSEPDKSENSLVYVLKSVNTSNSSVLTYY